MDILSTSLNIFVVVVLVILTFSSIKILIKERKGGKESNKECCGGKGDDCCGNRDDDKNECTCQSKDN